MNRYIEAAWIGKNAGKFPSKNQWLYKTLTNVNLITTSNPPELANFYDKVYDDSVTYGSGKTMSNEWIDNVLFQYWMIDAMQRNIFSAFKQADKIPMTTKGLEVVISKVREVLDFSVLENGLTNYQILNSTMNRSARSVYIEFSATETNSINEVDTVYGIIIN